MMAYQKPNKEDRNRQFLETQHVQNDYLEVDPYNEETINVNKKFLIVCEGENTEPDYFRKFPVVSKDVITVKGGYGGGKKYLVDKAEEYACEKQYESHSVWCVFDYDVKADNPNQKQDYDNAISMAIKKGYNVAYSNDCFELWLILHHDFIQHQHHRTEYFDMLRKKWKLERSYETIGKQQEFTEKLYEKLLPNQRTAIKNAKKLFESNDDGRPYHQMNPCTTVFKLVEELNRYLRR